MCEGGSWRSTGRCCRERRSRSCRARSAPASGRDRRVRRRPSRPPGGAASRRSTPGSHRPRSRSTRTRVWCSATASSCSRRSSAASSSSSRPASRRRSCSSSRTISSSRSPRSSPRACFAGSAPRSSLPVRTFASGTGAAAISRSSRSTASRSSACPRRGCLVHTHPRAAPRGRRRGAAARDPRPAARGGRSRRRR